MTNDEAFALSKLLSSNPQYKKANDRLRAKCRWEAMARAAVIVEWGDPRQWD